MRIAILLMFSLGFEAAAKTLDIHLYPPEVRVHAGGEGQTLLLIATDEEGVSREVPVAEAATEAKAEEPKAEKAAEAEEGESEKITA